MCAEAIGTSAVKMSLLKTGRITASIQEGDRDPSWDGMIYIHEDSKKNKKNIKTIKVQVKTKMVQRAASVKKVIQFPVKLTDLINYQHNGGSLFFVVYVDRVTMEPLQIYYSGFSPLKIQVLTKNKRKQATISLPFKKFPENNKEKLSILLDFYRHVKMQDSFSESEPIPIDALKEQGTLEGLTLFVRGINNNIDIFSYPDIIEKEELYIYAKTNDSPVLIPEEYYPSVSGVRLKTSFEGIISIDGIPFYDKFDLDYDKTTVRFIIDDCLLFSYPNCKSEEWSQVSFSFKLQGTLNRRLKTLDFILRIIKNQSFEINGKPFRFNKKEPELFSKLCDYNAFLKSVKRALSLLNVEDDLDLDQCTEEDINRLHTVIASVIDEKPVQINNMDYATVVTFQIANINICMLCEEVGDKLFRFYDFFQKQIDVVENTKDGRNLPISQYVIMKKEHFLSIDNISYQAIIDDIKRIKMNQSHLDLTVLLVLQMLHAFDENGNDELLDCCDVLIDYFISKSGEDVSSSIIIDQLQIAYRKRQLTFEEKHQLMEMAINDSDSLIKAASFILLQEKEKAGTTMKGFDSDQMEVFKQYPIYNLFMKLEDAENG